MKNLSDTPWTGFESRYYKSVAKRVCLSVCWQINSEKKVLNGGEYDIGWDYNWDNDIY